MSLNALLVILSVLMSSYLVFALLVISGRRSKSNGFLIIYLILFTLQFLGHLYSYVLFGYARYSQYNSALALCSPALMYLHGNYLVIPKKKIHSKYLLHFVPGLLILIVSLNNITLHEYHRIFVYVFAAVYAYFSLRLLKNYPTSNTTELSGQNITAKWLIGIYIIFYSIFSIDAIFFMAFNQLVNIHYYIEILIICGSIFLLSYIFIRLKSPVYSSVVFGKGLIVSEIDDLGSPIHNSPEQRQIIMALKKHMQKDQPYLNPELKIEDLSKEILIPKRVLSEIINRQFGINFTTFINLYRLNMATQLLKDQTKEDLSISEIMYMTGFSSKSVFNTSFKRKMGITPTAYRSKFGIAIKKN